MKTCSMCLWEKPLEEFPRQARSRDGYSYYCRPCNSAAASAWKRDNPERNQRTQLRRLAKRYGYQLVPNEEAT